MDKDGKKTTSGFSNSKQRRFDKPKSCGCWCYRSQASSNFPKSSLDQKLSQKDGSLLVSLSFLIGKNRFSGRLKQQPDPKLSWNIPSSSCCPSVPNELNNFFRFSLAGLGAYTQWCMFTGHQATGALASFVKPHKSDWAMVAFLYLHKARVFSAFFGRRSEAFYKNWAFLRIECGRNAEAFERPWCLSRSGPNLLDLAKTCFNCWAGCGAQFWDVVSLATSYGVPSCTAKSLLYTLYRKWGYTWEWSTEPLLVCLWRSWCFSALVFATNLWVRSQLDHRRDGLHLGSKMVQKELWLSTDDTDAFFQRTHQVL